LNEAVRLQVPLLNWRDIRSNLYPLALKSVYNFPKLLLSSRKNVKMPISFLYNWHHNIYEQQCPLRIPCLTVSSICYKQRFRQ